MSDINHLLHLQSVAPSASFIAAGAMAECRAEWEKIVSLVEAGLAEAEIGSVEGPESAAWKRAVNIGKVIRDVAIANVERIAATERRVSLLAMLEAGRQFTREERFGASGEGGIA